MRPKTLPVLSTIAMLVTLTMGLVVFGCGGTGSASTSVSTVPQTSGEVEATEFQGAELTPISEQGNNALKGTQVICKFC